MGQLLQYHNTFKGNLNARQNFYTNQQPSYESKGSWNYKAKKIKSTRMSGIK